MRLLRFEKSRNKSKKYDAILLTPEGKEKRVSFGAIGYQQYKDSTPLKLYSHLDHGDLKRRDAYRARHGKEYIKAQKYSPSWLSWTYLW